MTLITYRIVIYNARAEGVKNISERKVFEVPNEKGPINVPEVKIMRCPEC